MALSLLPLGSTAQLVDIPHVPDTHRQHSLAFLIVSGEHADSFLPVLQGWSSGGQHRLVHYTHLSCLPELKLKRAGLDPISTVRQQTPGFFGEKLAHIGCSSARTQRLRLRALLHLHRCLSSLEPDALPYDPNSGSLDKVSVYCHLSKHVGELLTTLVRRPLRAALPVPQLDSCSFQSQLMLQCDFAFRDHGNGSPR